jgi:hypothetical protein
VQCIPPPLSFLIFSVGFWMGNNRSVIRYSTTTLCTL